MKRILFCALIILMLFGISIAQAAPVDLPSGVTNKEGLFSENAADKDFKRHFEIVDSWLDSISVSLTAEADFIEERELDSLDAEMEGEVFTGKVKVSFNNKLDIYAFGGQTQDIEYRATIGGSQVVFGLDDEIIWGGGISAVLYDWQDSGVQLFLDGKYRQIDHADYGTVRVGNTTFQKSQLSAPTSDAEYREYQGALGLSARIGKVIPYFGIRYSNVEVKARATASGTTYDLGEIESKDNVGPFAGIALAPLDGVSINAQARFIDEQAFSGSATIRF